MARKIKQYSEANLIKLFDLESLIGNNVHPLMQEWKRQTDSNGQPDWSSLRSHVNC
jgi:hypothetical protein